MSEPVLILFETDAYEMAKAFTSRRLAHFSRDIRRQPQSLNRHCAIIGRENVPVTLPDLGTLTKWRNTNHSS